MTKSTSTKSSACCIPLLLLLWISAVAAAQALAPDAGLVTKLSGKVTYRNDSLQKEWLEAEAFMKVRQGDRINVPEGGIAQVTYFAGGRQETWKGPVELKVGEREGQPEGKGAELIKPDIRTLPAKATRGVRQIPALFRKAGISRVGGTMLRAVAGEEEPQPHEPPSLSDEENAEIQAARQVYTEMNRQAPKDDVTPELFLIGMYYDYQLYLEMADVLKSARQKQPDNEELKSLQEWLERKLR